ncbi:MAG: RagB/SusD family nutrient uptake outer membrane protein [Odoribacteraceae bacterium]|nr:RagB/SusD family nutrient uptake outer membrane protein [Odoribacteraceae bacterium]
MKKYISLHLFFLSILVCSCEQWIDVRPSDRVSERMLFESREGFLKALNGVYTGLVDRALYGRMTLGPLELMGQYFKGNGNFNGAYSQYRYTANDEVKNTFSNYWKRAYYLIVNCNNIIDQCGEQNALLPGTWHALVKGETLALRAFLHLDLLRLFGPIYSKGKDVASIPYVTNSNLEITPMMTAEKVMGYILADLTEALRLLKDSDPIFENGVANSSSSDGDNSLRYRQYRMNYYAVKALLARAYLYSGDKETAYEHATGIIEEVQVAGSELFPFVTATAAMNTATPDRVFSPEVMFAAYDQHIVSSIFDRLYVPLLATNDLLTFPFQNHNTLYTGRISELYTDNSDIRYRTWWGVYTMTDASEKFNYFRKYEGVTVNTTSDKFRVMIPLVRLSEMFLIAAECDPTKEGADRWINTLREKRSCSSLLVSSSETERVNNVTAEFRREFLGEGQMFYFYKRLAVEVLPDAAQWQAGRTITMNLQQYVVPIPENETEQRN